MVPTTGVLTMTSDMVLPVRSMRTHAPQLDRSLRSRDVIYVQFQYRGVAGGFWNVDEILITYADGSPEVVQTSSLQTELTTTFLALIDERHPDWGAGNG